MDDPNATLQAFLSRHLTQCVEEVERVHGGFANFTFRLHLRKKLPFIVQDNSDDNNLLTLIHKWKPNSLIAKIAFPYFAVAVKTLPCPVSRQQIEERVLKLFNNFPHPAEDTKSNPIDLSLVLCRNKIIRISCAWLRDEINNVLIMKDYGPLLSIEQWFSLETRSSSTESTIVTAQLYGEQLGNFLVDLQVSSMFCIHQLKVLLDDSDLKQKMSMLIHDALENMRDSHGLLDVDELSSICMRYFEHGDLSSSTDSQVLTHGDFRPGNILIDELNGTLVLIDWELANVRSPAYDLAVLFAPCAFHTSTDSVYEVMLSFTNSFMDTYRNTAKRNGVSWYKNEREQYLFAYNLGMTYGIRLLFLSCHQKCCPTQNTICCHRRSIAKQGADYLRQCQLGPVKHTYDLMLRDQLLARLF